MKVARCIHLSDADRPATGGSQISAARIGDAGQTVALTRGNRPAALKGLGILAVDDDRNTLQMLSEALRCAGATVWEAASAREAFLQFQRHRPDILLSDIGMPEEDGCALLSRLRALPPHWDGTLPAVAVTGHARPEDLEAARAAGYQAVLAKPVNFDELARTILKLAARR